MVEFHKWLSAVLAGAVLFSLVFVLVRRFSKERVKLKKAKRIAKRIEEDIQLRMSKHVVQSSMVNKKLRTSLLREIKRINFSAWIDCVCLSNDNLYRFGTFGQVHYPKFTEHVLIIDGVRNILIWLALREFSHTKHTARLIENSFEIRPSVEMVSDILGREHHNDLWSTVDTLIRDEFPDIFQRMYLLIGVQRLEKSLDD